MRYPFVFHAKLPDGINGRAYGPIILLKDGLSGEWLYRHELAHVKQWSLIVAISMLVAIIIFIAGIHEPALLIGSLSVGFHAVLYKLRWYRQYAEAGAYRQSAKYRPDNIMNIAKALSENYDLDITIDEAITLIKEG